MCNCYRTDYSGFVSSGAKWSLRQIENCSGCLCGSWMGRGDLQSKTMRWIYRLPHNPLLMHGYCDFSPICGHFNHAFDDERDTTSPFWCCFAYNTESQPVKLVFGSREIANEQKQQIWIKMQFPIAFVVNTHRYNTLTELSVYLLAKFNEILWKSREKNIRNVAYASTPD